MEPDKAVLTSKHFWFYKTCDKTVLLGLVCILSLQNTYQVFLGQVCILILQNTDSSLLIHLKHLYSTPSIYTRKDNIKKTAQSKTTSTYAFASLNSHMDLNKKSSKQFIKRENNSSE